MGKYPCNLPFLLWGKQGGKGPAEIGAQMFLASYGVNKGEKGPLKLAPRCQQHARAWHRSGRTGHTKHTNGDDFIVKVQDQDTGSTWSK